MTHEEQVARIHHDRAMLEYHFEVRSLTAPDFYLWWECSTTEEVFRALDPVIFTNRPKDLAAQIGVDVQQVYMLRKKSGRKNKPGLLRTLRVLSCDVL